MSENTNERDAEAEPGALRAKVAQAVAPSSDEVRARLHAAREAKGKAPVDCWACEAFDEVIALLWEMHQAGYEQGLAGCASTVTMLKATEAERDEVSGRLSALLCDLTGGRLSKPTYDVPTMVQEIEEHLTRELEIDAEAGRDRARSLAATLEARLAQVEALAARWESARTWDNKPAIVDRCFGADLRGVIGPRESA